MGDRWAVVTGAAGGIGTAVCLQLAQQGLSVLMLDLQEGALAASTDRVRATGGRAEPMALDMIDPKAPAAALARPIGASATSSRPVGRMALASAARTSLRMRRSGRPRTTAPPSCSARKFVRGMRRSRHWWMR